MGTIYHYKKEKRQPLRKRGCRYYIALLIYSDPGFYVEMSTHLVFIFQFPNEDQPMQAIT